MLFTALALSAVQLPEQFDSATFDLRCMLVIGSMLDQVPEEQRPHFAAGSLFFFGRVDVRLSEAEIEGRVPREIEAIDAGDRAALLQACGEFMSARGRVLTTMGQRTEQRQREPQR